MDYIIIVAGGRGLRMGGDIPKQFMPIGGVPVLMRTLQRFRDYSPDLQIILVLPRDHQPYWRELCDKHHFTVDYQLADGGATRFHSVKNGLRLIPDGTKGVVRPIPGRRLLPGADPGPTAGAALEPISPFSPAAGRKSPGALWAPRRRSPRSVR